ncbi:MAG: DNA polymerase III subunit alpha [Gammaproteobacteria bacterium]
MRTFVHLYVHTEYSIVDGILTIPALVEAVSRGNMPAVAVTDQGNLFSMVKFYRAAMAAGVKPIIGLDAWVQEEPEEREPARVVLLCQDATGYRHLLQLVSRSYTEGQTRGAPVIQRAWLERASAGLIALSGGMAGDVGRALLNSQQEQARRLLGWWLEYFPDRYYLQLQRTGRQGEAQYLQQAVAMAAALDVPMVATNEVCFLSRDDFEAHEARVCIQEGRTLADQRRTRRYSNQQYLRSPEEMASLFRDFPEALENAVEIARRCNVALRLGQNFLPDFPVPAGKTATGWFEEQAWQGLTTRLASEKHSTTVGEETDRALYEARLRHEIEVITGMGYAGYFLIVADFIRWAREHDIPVGPGRGSGAGSLVAYSFGITDLDPILYDLLFERFLNPERVSLPDFDVDFCMVGRDQVIEYVTERYGGSDYVAQIITFGTMAAKAVVRDVGRVLGYPYGFVDQIAKLIPFDLGITLSRALAGEERLRQRYHDEEDVRTLIDLAMRLEGLVRNAGRHAGGVVIAPAPLTEFTPLYCEPGATSVVTQLDKDDVEAAGLVKFDFLGLRTLTIIDRAVKNINQYAGENQHQLNIAAIPLDDATAYDLIKRGATTAVFQLESRGMKDLIRRLLPDCFEDVIALVALFRPGPLQSGMVDDFIDRKHGRALVAYPHPGLETILKPTYGVILYQEQVMQIAQVLAGYTLGGADLLRRAMGKKKPAEMARQRAVFVAGAQERGVPEARANAIFDLMEKFAGYGFNKSHSAAYALLAYQTAWLKAHYPAAFMAAVLSADMDNTDKVVGFIEEARDCGLSVRVPDVNRCAYMFSVENEKTIRYGLGAIKGVGQSAVEAIIAAREAHGEFADLFQFCRAIDLRKVNRRVVEALIRAGALDCLGASRASMMATLTQAMIAAEQTTRDRAVGQNDLFGGASAARPPDPQSVQCEEWPEAERLLGEKETLGLYLTGHPITQFEAELAHFTSHRLAEARPNAGRSAVVAGYVVSLRTLNSRNGRMAVIALDDRTARLEAIVYAEAFERFREVLAKDALVIAEGEVAADDYSGRYVMTVKNLYDLERARERYATHLSIEVTAQQLGSGFVNRLAGVLSPYRQGSIPVFIDYRRADAAVRLALGDAWRIRPSESLLKSLAALAGNDAVKLIYG